MGWEFEDFKNYLSWGFEIGPCRQTIEFLPLRQRIEFFAIEVAVKFFGSWPTKINWDLKHHEMCRTLGGVVSIVWLRKTFKNCVSLLMSKNRSQKLINHLYLNNGLHLFLSVICFRLYLPVFINVPLDWYHYDYYRGYTTHF